MLLRLLLLLLLRHCFSCSEARVAVRVVVVVPERSHDTRHLINVLAVRRRIDDDASYAATAEERRDEASQLGAAFHARMTPEELDFHVD